MDSNDINILEKASEEEIKKEAESIVKEKVINNVNINYPFEKMNPVFFETMAFDLLTEDKFNFGFVSSDTVFPGKKVCDEGRDATIYNNSGDLICVIQCKRYKTELDKHTIYSEVIKSLLYLIMNNKYSSFKKFIFMTIHGVKQTEQELIAGFSKKFEFDYILEIAKELCLNYKSLEQFDIPANENRIKASCEKLELAVIEETQLETLLSKYPFVRDQYFELPKEKTNDVSTQINQSSSVTICKPITVSSIKKNDFEIVCEEIEKLKSRALEALYEILVAYIDYGSETIPGDLYYANYDIENKIPRDEAYMGLELLYYAGFIDCNLEDVEDIRITTSRTMKTKKMNDRHYVLLELANAYSEDLDQLKDIIIHKNFYKVEFTEE